MRTMILLLCAVALASGLGVTEKNEDAEWTYTCPMFTDEIGDLYNINGLSNGGEGHYSPYHNEAGKYFRLAICEVFSQRYKHSECGNTTGVCYAEKTGDDEFKGYNVGDAQSAKFSTFAGKPAHTDGLIVEMDGLAADKPPQCADGTTPKSIIKLSCDYNRQWMDISFSNLDTATCTFTFTGTAREACSLNRCPVYSNEFGSIDLNAVNDGHFIQIPAKDPGTPTGHNGMKLTICGSLREGESNCTIPGVAVCEEWDGPDGHKNWKDLASATGWTLSTIGNEREPDGVRLTTGTGEFSNSCEHANTAEFTIRCDAAATGTPVVEFSGRDDATCTWKYAVTHSSACIVYNHPAGPGAFVGNTWLSAGSIMTIIFFVGGAVYLMVGCGINFAQGKRGGEMLPNRGSWGALGGLIMEGIAFTLGKITGKGGGSYYTV